MRTDYKNIHGLVTGLKALLKREGLPVGHWYKGRITHKFSHGVKVEAMVDAVFVDTFSTHRASLTEVAEVLEANGIEFKTVNVPGGQRLEIPARKYCKEGSI